MEKEHDGLEADVSTPCLTEDTMEPIMESVMVQLGSRTTATNPCTHSRAIDDVLTKSKTRRRQGPLPRVRRGL